MSMVRRALITAAGLAWVASACGAAKTDDTRCRSGQRQSPVDIHDVRALPALPVDPARWLPANHADYRCEGLLTAAPWARLGQLFGPNARRVQPLYGRVFTLTP